jgi:hypothetical protein
MSSDNGDDTSASSVSSLAELPPCSCRGCKLPEPLDWSCLEQPLDEVSELLELGGPSELPLIRYSACWLLLLGSHLLGGPPITFLSWTTSRFGLSQSTWTLRIQSLPV